MICLWVQAASAEGMAMPPAAVPLLEEAGEEKTWVHRDSEDEANTSGIGM